MKEDQLLKTIKIISNNIYRNDTDVSIAANELLNQFKGNPMYIKRFKLSRQKYFYNLFLYLGKFIYLVLLNILFSIYSTLFKKKIYQSTEIDLIMISQIISVSQNENKDIYFGSISKILKKKKFRLKKIYINNLGLSFINRKFHNLHSPNNIIINTNIYFLQLFKIYFSLLKKYFKYLFLSFKIENKEKNQILKIISLEFLNPKTLNNLIIERKVFKFISENNVKNLALTFEGFSWEKMVLYAAKQASPKTNVIGYQFACLTKNQILHSKSMSRSYKPDVIWTNGLLNKKKLQKKFENVTVIGTDRINGKVNKNQKSKNNILVMPEGIIEEIDLMMKFSLSCANKYPNLKFIWRFHPSISKNYIRKNFMNEIIPRNIIISNKKLFEDISTCSSFFYRGSTTAVVALQHGLFPFYLNLKKSINIDPLYDFNSWKMVVNSISDFKNFNYNLNRFLSQKKRKKDAINFSKKYFIKLNPKKIIKSLI